MIQRKQTLWLLLAGAGGIAMSQLPIFHGTLANNTVLQVMASDSLFLFALLMGIGCLCIINIFLFKNRKLQFKLAIISILLVLIAIALQVVKVENFKSSNSLIRGTYQLAGLIPVAMLLLLILAARGIYKDEKLVKGMDRLR